MKNFTRLVFILAAVSFSADAMAAKKPQPAQIETAGILKCDVDAGIGLILGSRKTLSCNFESRNGRSEHYIGTIGKVGLDIGVTGKSHMSWRVSRAPASGNTSPNLTLTGNYSGLSAEAAVGLGLGTNVLLGGSGKSVVLQPFSAEATGGLNLAIGLSQIHLEAVTVATDHGHAKPRGHKH
jgi:hypothetical protein